MNDEITLAVDRLVEARRSQTLVNAPTLPDSASAYAVQTEVAQALGWFPHGPARHWKSGGPAGPEPLTHAPLPPSGIWHSPAQAREAFFAWRGIEAEVALRLGVALGAQDVAQLDAAGARSLVDAMCVAIEVVDSRWIEGRDAPALARLADLQSHGALVLGTWQPFEVRDWSQQACRVRIGAREAQAFRGSHSLGDPTQVLPQWLRHATQGGAVLEAGTVVTTGTWCGLLLAQAGDEVVVAFDGLGEARVQL